VENLAPQAYWHCDVGVAKVEATAEACRLLNPAVPLAVRCERFRRSSPKDLSTFVDEGPSPRDAAVFCCVDSVATRRLVWESVRSRCAFWSDGRMSAEVIRVLSSADPPTDEHYETTLFSPQEAYVGSCTARSTVYAASVAAGLMLSGFTRWLRGMPPERDLTLNLLAGELTVR
jgi:sulfur carrier protein ThiS adenylyltransferase